MRGTITTRAALPLWTGRSGPGHPSAAHLARVACLACVAHVASVAHAKPHQATVECRKDDDCRFAFRDPCDRACPPCGTTWRSAQSRNAYRQSERVWAIKVPACQRCVRRCKTRWRGDRAVCAKGACTVVDKGPLPLRSYVGARIGAQVYRLTMRWMNSMGRLVPAATIEPPSGYVVSLELHGLDRSRFGPVAQLADVEIILSSKATLSPPGKRRVGRMRFDAKVLGVSKLRAASQPSTPK